MKLRQLFIATFFVLVPALSAWAVPGTVRLKNGGWVEGEVLEVLPGERVTVRGADGATRQIPWAEVERVDQGHAAPAAAPPTVGPEPAAEPAAAPATAPEPAAPAKRSTVLALDDPNTHRVLLMSGDTKIYFLGLPRTDDASVALRFERYVRAAELSECKELLIKIDATQSSYPLQHKVVREGTGFREIVQAQATIELIELMAEARDINFDICQKPRPLDFVSHHAPIVRFVQEFKALIGKPELAYIPTAGAAGRDYEAVPSSTYSGESLSELRERRRRIGIAGPIVLTAAGGGVSLAGVYFLLLGIAASSSDQEDVADVGTGLTAVGVIGVVAGGVGLTVGIATLSSRIKERRELGDRIKQLRSDRQPSDGPRLARTEPLYTLRF